MSGDARDDGPKATIDISEIEPGARLVMHYNPPHPPDCLVVKELCWVPGGARPDGKVVMVITAVYETTVAHL